METQKWGPLVTNHLVIGVGPLRHHKSSCCERSTDLITTKVKVKRVLSFIFFLLLYCPYGKMCAYVLTQWHFFCCGSFILTGRETRSDKNIVLSQPGESFSDLKLKRCSRVTWGCFKIRVRTQKKWNKRSWTQPNWAECSKWREPESLNIHWMAINVQYSA